MSAIVYLRVFRNFQQFVSIRPISNYPTSFRKNQEIQKVDGIYHIFKLALRIDYLHVNGMCSCVVPGFLLKFIRRITFSGFESKQLVEYEVIRTQSIQESSSSSSNKTPTDEDWPSVWSVCQVFPSSLCPTALAAELSCSRGNTTW